MDISDNVTSTSPNVSLSGILTSTQSSITPTLIESTKVFTKSVDNSDTKEESSSPSFNFALIPFFLLIIIIIVCFTCCKRFRNFTKRDKSDKVLILVDDDIEDGDDDWSVNIEMSPDSAYDSYCSVSRRHNSGEDNSLQEVQGTTSRDHPIAGTSVNELNRKKSSKKRGHFEDPIPNGINNRKPSPSSSQNTMATCSEGDTSPTHSAIHNTKHSDRRVSTVTQVQVETRRITSACSCTPQSKLNGFQCKACYEKQKSRLLSKSRGTQTTKSFTHRYSKKRKSSGNNNVNPETTKSNSDSNNSVDDVNASVNNNSVGKMCNGDIKGVRSKNVSIINVTHDNKSVNRQNPQTNCEISAKL